jgi:hypothetical protein
MFCVTEADAAAIRTVYEQDGELSAAIELRRRFPGITDNENARLCARSIAGWTPLADRPATVPRRRARPVTARG